MTVLARFGNAARWCVRRILEFYYPRIEVEGREHLPTAGGILFVANHPNSLMDPALVGFAVRRSVHFFAKAPLFEVPVFGTLMTALGMVPAYRGQDDKAAVKRNLETLDVGADYLCRGEAVGIFPEGKTHDLDRVEQVRSGAARIAWQAVQRGAQLKIVPLGLNYERKERFRSTVWVRIGEAIEADDFFRAHAGEEKKAMRALTEAINSQLKHLVVHLEDERWQPFLAELEILLPPDSSQANESIAALRQRKRLADAINYFSATDRARAEAAAAEIESHRALLDAAGLPMNSPVLRLGVARLTAQLLSEFLLLCLGFVPAVAGVIHHLVPVLVMRGIVRLVKYPGRTTIAQNRLMIGLPVFGIWYVLIWWLLAAKTELWLAWVWTALMPLAGVTALHYVWRARHARRALWQELKMLARPKELTRLRISRAELRRRLEQLRKEYYERGNPNPSAVANSSTAPVCKD